MGSPDWWAPSVSSMSSSFPPLLAFFAASSADLSPMDGAKGYLDASAISSRSFSSSRWVHLSVIGRESLSILSPFAFLPIGAGAAASPPPQAVFGRNVSSAISSAATFSITFAMECLFRGARVKVLGTRSSGLAFLLFFLLLWAAACEGSAASAPADEGDGMRWDGLESSPRNGRSRIVSSPASFSSSSSSSSDRKDETSRPLSPLKKSVTSTGEDPASSSSSRSLVPEPLTTSSSSLPSPNILIRRPYDRPVSKPSSPSWSSCCPWKDRSNLFRSRSSSRSLMSASTCSMDASCTLPSPDIVQSLPSRSQRCCQSHALLKSVPVVPKERFKKKKKGGAFGGELSLAELVAPTRVFRTSASGRERPCPRPPLPPPPRGSPTLDCLFLFSRQQFSFLNLKMMHVVGIRVWKREDPKPMGGPILEVGLVVTRADVLKTVFLPADNVQAKGVFSQ